MGTTPSVVMAKENDGQESLISFLIPPIMPARLDTPVGYDGIVLTKQSEGQIGYALLAVAIERLEIEHEASEVQIGHETPKVQIGHEKPPLMKMKMINMMEMV